jgi:hypothetical protein
MHGHLTSRRQYVARVGSFAEAKTRAGGRCQVRAEPGRARCRFHGGKSTLGKTVRRVKHGKDRSQSHWLTFRKVDLERLRLQRGPRELMQSLRHHA